MLYIHIYHKYIYKYITKPKTPLVKYSLIRLKKTKSLQLLLLNLSPHST